MFGKKSTADPKKAVQKFLDHKKDTATRLKYLRNILESIDLGEAKTLFEANYSSVYYVFYDQFITVESNLRQRAHKTYREELDVVLIIFEKILVLLPELLSRKWQCHSIGRLMKKLLHPGNALKLRREAIRLFLLWYQILGENAPRELHWTFACLVPGFGVCEDGLQLCLEGIIAGASVSPKPAPEISVVSLLDIGPVLPPQSGDRQVDDQTKFFLECLMDFMVTQVTRIEWRDKALLMQQRCFQFLFDKFKRFYLPVIFAEFSWKTSLYKPWLELPDMVPYCARVVVDAVESKNQSLSARSLCYCQVVVIRWIANFTHSMAIAVHGTPSSGSVMEDSDGLASKEARAAAPIDLHVEKSQSNALGSGAGAEKDSNWSYGGVGARDEHAYVDHGLVRNVLYSSRENVNLVHEIFRQALLLRWSEAATMRRVICVYRDWITLQTSELPAFMLEPHDAASFGPSRDEKFHHHGAKGLHSSVADGILSSAEISGNLRAACRLRNDSYLGAIHRENLNVRAGLQSTLLVFVTNAANVFLQEIGPADRDYLDDQVDMCKRVLNIYRYIVMNVTMEQKTWEQLLLILLHVTSQILGEHIPAKKEDSLGGRLAPAVFQTLIVTWIKANLNVVISTELWDQFLHVLSSLTHWEELIREWAKTMETLTRVLAKMVYGLDLNDLPLDRLSEQKQKRRRGRQVPTTAAAAAAATESQPTQLPRGWSRQGLEGPSPQMERVTPDASSSSWSVNSRLKSVTPVEGHTVWHSDVVRSRSNSGDEVDGGTGAGRGGRRRSHRSASRSSSARISRSVSEGNLSTRTRQSSVRFSRESSTEPPSSLPSSIPLSVAAEQEMAKMVATAEEYMKETKAAAAARVGKSSSIRRSKSMDSLRFARASTPSSLSESSMDALSRSPSPSPSTGLESNSIKDSPMQIDTVSGDTSCCTHAEAWRSMSREELHSVMAGGTVSGWLPDVSVVLWRRMLGALGDVNAIADPEMHAHVFQHLIELFETLVKIRENQGIPSINQVSPPPPEFIPPLNILAPWCFKALMLSDSYKKGKLHACHLLCSMTVRRHDIALSREHYVQFYLVLHSSLVGADQDVVSTIVRYCGPRLFSSQIPGATMLMLDFIYAADAIAMSSDLKEVPRTEAMAILGALLCFPSVYTEMLIMQPNSLELARLNQNVAKDHIVSVLLKAGRREPSGLARCVALSSLGIYLYGELAHGSNHSKMRDAFNVLLAALRQTSLEGTKVTGSKEISNKIVAKVACDMLHLLTDHVDALLRWFSEVPKKIIEVLAATLHGLLPRHDAGSTTTTETDKRLLIAMIFCLGEWCMRMPRAVLVERDVNQESLLLMVFKVLNSAVSGVLSAHQGAAAAAAAAASASAAAAAATLVDLASPEFDLSIHVDGSQDNSSSSTSAADSPSSKVESPPPPEFGTSNAAATTPQQQQQQASPVFVVAPDGGDVLGLIRLAARTVMTHLVNHLGHFPMGIGAARLTSLVSEHDDIPGLACDDLTSEIFDAPNVQFFVLNNQTLMSFVELPALVVPGGGVTAGLTTAKSQVRVILRDMSGKFSWDTSILYGPPGCWQNSQTPDSYCDSGVFWNSRDADLLSVVHHHHHHHPPPNPNAHLVRHRPASVLPTFDNTEQDMDNLNDLLQYVGHSSPECLYNLGLPLNIPQGPPPSLCPEIEEEAMTTVLNQRNFERDYCDRCLDDPGLTSRPVRMSSPVEPESPFQHCRLLINQLGLMAWEKRPHFDLLKKNEKLLRELRNLDNQKCRETHKIAVIYVAEGQEDKNSVLQNAGGCQAYEEFVAGLAWEVELRTHTGFMGGLQHNGSTGDTAPYYATSFVEAIFHVATRMPSSSEESMIQKVRHLGNDEIHIVWSEHSRDYRHGILTTEFGDVLIVIYPLPNRLYRIQIAQKPEVPFFGPLFNGAIVDHKVLPGLVRATAINASRATRSTMPVYQHFYKERAKAFEAIVKCHKDPSAFEDFTSSVVLPATPKAFQYGSSRASGSGHAKPDSSNVLALSNLAAALLDSHTRHHNPPSAFHSRPSSLSSSSEQSTPATLHEVHFRVSESFDCTTDLVDDAQGSSGKAATSPKRSKRRSFKANARRTTSPTPQESSPPQQKGKN